MTNETRAAFYAAFAKAQGAIEGAVKNSTNPHFQNKYADLGAVWDACREHLSSNGLSVMQFPDYDIDRKTVSVRTVIAHASGHAEQFTTRLPVQKPDAQGAGSAITYARRYALMAAVGIAPEDDDGNAASQPVGHGTGYRKDGKPTAAKAKDGGEGSWQSFVARLKEFTDPKECERWFHSVSVQRAINQWPVSDAGDWAELAADEYDAHMRSLFGTSGIAAE